MLRLGFGLSLVAFIFSTPALAADICEARVLQRTPARENPDSSMKPGETFGAITQFVQEKKSGQTLLCAHGGYCYPTHVKIGGKRVVALQLTNCTVNRVVASDDEDETIRYLDVLRSKVPPARLRLYDISRALEERGLIQIAADNAAVFFVNKPNSSCGNLVRKALAKDRRAIAMLNDGVPYCQ